MPLPIIRYLLDPTGENPDNRVNGEVHELNSRDIRAVAPRYGPFFSHNLVVYDHSTNRLLERGKDYQCVELLQEATLRYGKEILQLILILDKTVSNIVRIDYTVLGGHYQRDASAIVNMYETVMKDDRPVDWINVMNKPYEFNPTLHKHFMSDIDGFQFLAVALERIRNAIVLSDVPAFEALIEWVKSRTLDVVTEHEIDNVIPVNKIVTFERLLYAMERLNFNSIKIRPSTGYLNVNSFIEFKISSTKMDDGTILYWRVVHIDTNDEDFSNIAGSFNMVGDESSFILSARDNVEIEDEEEFYVSIRKNSPSGPELARTSIMKLRGRPRHKIDEYLQLCCLYNPEYPINATMYYITGKKMFAEFPSTLGKNTIALNERVKQVNEYMLTCCPYKPKYKQTAESRMWLMHKISNRGDRL